MSLFNSVPCRIIESDFTTVAYFTVANLSLTWNLDSLLGLS